MRRLPTALLPLLLAAGCSSSELPDRGAQQALAAPSIAVLSTDHVVIGETLEFLGHNLAVQTQGLGATAHETALHLKGTFTDQDGLSFPTTLTLPTVFSGTVERKGELFDVLSWSRVGPFANPFTQDDRIGHFEGTVTPIRTDAQGVTTQGEARPFKLTIEPSIIIERLEPLEADCGAPALRGLPGLPYALEVRTAGLQATRFRYEISRANGQKLYVVEHHLDPSEPPGFDRLGLKEPLVFEPIEDEGQSYVAAIRVFAADDAGRQVETALPFSIHRPIEVRYEGSYQLAERYEPIPVSGCIPGTINTSVSYEESRTEQRQQTVSVSLSRNWSNSQGRSVSHSMYEGISQGESRAREFGQTDWEGESAYESQGVSYHQSESNRVGYSSSDGESWRWDLSEGESEEAYQERTQGMFGEGSADITVGAKGSGSIPGFASVSGSVSTSAGVTAGARTSGTSGGSRRSSTEQGWSMGGEHNESRSFGSSTSEGRSESMSGSYALSESRSRTSRDSSSESNTRTWAISQGLSESERATTGNSEAINETWVESSAVTTRQGFSASIPRGRVGMFYRQTTRFVRRAEVRSYDKCGLAGHMGELQFNEWTWAPDLAIGEHCEGEGPRSNLPKAACFIEPCDG